MKKKLLTAALIFVIAVITIAGCSDTGMPAEETETETAEAADETEAEEETEPEETVPAADETVDPGLSEVEEVIRQAESMSMEELAAKAIEESNGATFYGIGSSSRGAEALSLFTEYLRTIDPSYELKYEWQQIDNNKIFEQLQADSLKKSGTFSMALIQDGAQISSKLVNNGLLETYIPLEWDEACGITADGFEGFLPLLTLNKVFMYNSTGDYTVSNCWDLVAEDCRPLFVDIDAEPVGKNFLCMLTKEEYAAWIKEAYEELDEESQAYFEPFIEKAAAETSDLGLGDDVKYALAWIKLWIENSNVQTDDGQIVNILSSDSSADQSGLLAYSALGSVEESAGVSKSNVKVAAYDEGYEGIGGFGYCYYLFLTDNCPLPWTACSFIQYMTCTADGFSPWGRDPGRYSSNPGVAAETEEIFHHSMDGGDPGFECADDRGYDWWIGDGKLVLEDPDYLASVSDTVEDLIETFYDNSGS